MSQASDKTFPTDMIAVITSLKDADPYRLNATACAWAKYLRVENPAEVLYTAFHCSVTENEEERIWASWARDQMPGWSQFCDVTRLWAEHIAVESGLCTQAEIDDASWYRRVTEEGSAVTTATTRAISSSLNYGRS